jgi:hypothetical protein
MPRAFAYQPGHPVEIGGVPGFRLSKADPEFTFFFPSVAAGFVKCRQCLFEGQKVPGYLPPSISRFWAVMKPAWALQR